MSKITVLAKAVGSAVRKNSPTIAAVIAVGGLCTTVILVGKAAPKATRLLEDAKADKADKMGLIDAEIEQGNYSEADVDNPYIYGTIVQQASRRVKLSFWEKVKITAPVYWPAALAGGGTIFFIIFGHSVSQRRLAALGAAYQVSEATLKEYQQKVIETVGEKQHEAICDEIARDRMEKDPITTKHIYSTGDGEHLCYDSWSGRYFKTDINKLKATVNELNAILLKEGWVSLNDFYDRIGLDGLKKGEDLGWWMEKAGDLIEVRYSSQLAKDGTPCLVFDFVVEPYYP